MTLVFMDFDGTITKKDTFFAFIRFHKSHFPFYLGIFLLLPILIGYKLKLIPNWRAKELLFSYYFKGVNENELNIAGGNFTSEILPKLIRNEAKEAIKTHKENRDEIIIVTASFPIWIKPWCDKYGLDLIATQYQLANGKLTGLIKGKNCYGKEKVKRIKQKFDLTKVNKIYAYGDSKADLEMLNIANIKFLKWKRID